MSNQLKGSLNTTGKLQAKSVSIVAKPKLSELADIDISAREDGSMVIWDELSQTFKVQGEMKNPKLFIAGGSF